MYTTWGAYFCGHPRYIVTT